MLFLIDLLNDSLTDFSKQTGFARQDLVMIVCLLLCYPASFFFLWLRRRTASPFVRHCYSILPALAASVWLFGWDTLHSFVSSTIGYFLVLFFKGTQYSYKVMFVYAMTYLSASHLFRWVLKAAQDFSSHPQAFGTPTWIGNSISLGHRCWSPSKWSP